MSSTRFVDPTRFASASPLHHKTKNASILEAPDTNCTHCAACRRACFTARRKTFSACSETLLRVVVRILAKCATRLAHKSFKTCASSQDVVSRTARDRGTSRADFAIDALALDFNRWRSSCRRAIVRKAARRAARCRRSCAAPARAIANRSIARTSRARDLFARNASLDPDKDLVPRDRPRAPPNVNRIEAIPLDARPHGMQAAARGQLLQALVELFRPGKCVVSAQSATGECAGADERVAPRRERGDVVGRRQRQHDWRAARHTRPCDSIDALFNPFENRFDRRAIQDVVADVGDERRGVRRRQRGERIPKSALKNSRKLSGEHGARQAIRSAVT